MKIGRVAFLLILLACFAAAADSDFRSLTGTVVDNRGNALPDAVVQIENTSTLEVRSYITDKKGVYHFSQLLSDVDYTVKARYRRVWSHQKTLSKFDGKSDAQMILVVPVE